MTEGQMDRLLDLLERALSWTILRFAPDEPRDPLESPLETYRDVLEAAAVSGPKRKRGRPRLTPEQKATRVAAMKDAEIAAFAPESLHHEGLKEAMKNEQETYTCTYCGRVFPETIHELHETNCSRSAAGYASHEATPGKR